MADVPAFDPSKPFEEVSGVPAFDPSKPFESATEAATPTKGGFQQRQHAYRENLRVGPPEQPAGQTATGPDLSAERRTPERLATEWGQVAKGTAKGVPASISGGLLGDAEDIGRHAINKLFKYRPSDPDPISKETFIPKTTEGGYLGPRGLGVMDQAANPEEAGGMGLGSILGPGGLLKGLSYVRGAAKPAGLPVPTPSAPAAIPEVKTVDMMTGKPPVVPEALPTAPPGSPIPVVNERSGARLLATDVPHVPTSAIEDTLAARPSVGAAGAGNPLADISPETIAKLRKHFEEEGLTPYTLEARLEEMSPHQSMAEFSPNMEAHAGAVASPPGAGKNEVINFFAQRAKEAKDRMRSIFDTAFGETENLAQLQRTREIDQNKAANPLYKKFKELTIEPTEAMQSLIPRLEAADAFGEARKLAGIKGMPWNQEYFSTGTKKYPTAETWDLVKQALDSKIESSFHEGKPTKFTRAYTELKHDLINAIDNHPDPEVAGVWKQARQTFATPAQINEAEKLGRKFFSLDHDEVQFITAGFSDGQMAGFKRGIRKEAENLLGKPGRTELPTMRKILSENTQDALGSIIGDEATNALVRSIEHEFNMHGAPTRIHGNSPTALRQEANKAWTMSEDGFGLPELAEVGVGLATKPVKTVMKGASKLGLSKYTANQEARAAKLRDEAARVFTLQGPERDAVIRYLTRSPLERSNVRQIRQSGGRTNQRRAMPPGARRAMHGAKHGH